MPKRPRVPFIWTQRRRLFSRWLRSRRDPDNPSNIMPFTTQEAANDLNLKPDAVRNMISYWREMCKKYWRLIIPKSTDVIKDWNTFVHNLNDAYDVFYLISGVHTGGRRVWYQPDFFEKEERDNILVARHIQGIKTRIDEMALMGELLLPTKIPAKVALEGIKDVDRRLLRDGADHPTDGVYYSEKVRVYHCPYCHSGTMRQLRNLDWRCTECKATIPEDDFNEMIKGAVPEDEGSE